MNKYSIKRGMRLEGTYSNITATIINIDTQRNIIELSQSNHYNYQAPLEFVVSQINRGVLTLKNP